jgi:hypothetical protein
MRWIPLFQYSMTDNCTWASTRVTCQLPRFSCCASSKTSHRLPKTPDENRSSQRRQSISVSEKTIKAAREIDSLHRQEWASENVNANGRRALVAIAQRHIGELSNAIARLETQWGSFQLWIKQPKRAFSESLVQAWRNGELDFEDFLLWFREHELGLPGPELDAYIAQVLLGVPRLGSEIALLGDPQTIAGLDEGEVYNAILGQARYRKEAEQRIARYNTRGRLDPVVKTYQQLAPLWAGEQMNPMFSPGEPRHKPVDEAAFLQILPGIKGNDFLSPMKSAFTREATRQLFLQAGVKPKHASFGVRMIHGDAKQEDNPSAWKSIYRKRRDIAIRARRLLDCR